MSQQSVPMNPRLRKTIEFLNGIGLRTRIGDGSGGAADGIRIDAGELLVSPVAQVSSLLHEAGHLAAIPGRFRHLAEGRLSAVFRAIADQTDWSDPDGPEAVAAVQCADPEATAWAWAAGQHLGLAGRDISDHGDYEGDGRFMRLGLAGNAYAGINGLARAGWCVVRAGKLEVLRSLPAYPRLVRWLQDR